MSVDNPQKRVIFFSAVVNQGPCRITIPCPPTLQSSVLPTPPRRRGLVFSNFPMYLYTVKNIHLAVHIIF